MRKALRISQLKYICGQICYCCLLTTQIIHCSLNVNGTLHSLFSISCSSDVFNCYSSVLTNFSVCFLQSVEYSGLAETTRVWLLTSPTVYLMWLFRARKAWSKEVLAASYSLNLSGKEALWLTATDVFICIAVFSIWLASWIRQTVILFTSKHALVIEGKLEKVQGPVCEVNVVDRLLEGHAEFYAVTALFKQVRTNFRHYNSDVYFWH